MRLPSVGGLAVVSGLVVLTGWLVAPLPFMLEANAQISAEEAGEAVEYLRDCLERGDVVEIPAGLASRKDAVLPIVVSVWRDGRKAHVGQALGKPLPDALEELASAMIAKKGRLAGDATKIQLDMALAEGWVPTGGVLFSLAFVEGHDGVSGLVDGQRVYLPPPDLIRWRSYGSFKPLPSYDSRFKMGIDAHRVIALVRRQARALGNKGKETTDLRRFNCLTMVEGADGVPRRLLKGTVDRPRADRAAVERSVLAGAEYLVRSLRDDGIFRYYYDPIRDKDLPGTYNWPRHAGTAYSLALVGRIMDRPDLVAVAGRALEGFEKQLVDGPEGSRCLLAKGNCYLGSSALGLLALSEYRIASGDGRFDGSARGLSDFLRYMQKEDGTFHHEWYPSKGLNKSLMKLYASQQAVLALGRHARAVDDEPAKSAAQKGMDYLAGPYWDFFLGSYFFGQEHWSCLAAEELYDQLKKPEYARFCYDIGTHYDNVTHNTGETPFREDVGGMSITHMITPDTGGTATAAEAMVSAIVLGEAEGRDVVGLERQLADTLSFLVKGQVQADDTFWMPDAAFSVGGFFETQTRGKVRIDTVQHSISAMVRGLEYL